MNISEALGKPREGFHAERMVGDLARNDVLGTIAIAVMVSAYWDVPLWKSLGGLFLLGEIAHVAAGVDTAVIVGLKNILNR